MNDSTLPLKLRRAIRDEWDPPSSRTQKSRAGLSTELGFPVDVSILWKGLVDTLESPSDPDIGETFTRIVDLVCYIFTQVLARLEDEEWGYAFLEHLPNKHLTLAVVAAEGRKTSFGWSNDYIAGTLSLAIANDLFTHGAFAKVDDGFDSLCNRKTSDGLEYDPSKSTLPVRPPPPATSNVPAQRSSPPTTSSALSPSPLPILSSIPAPQHLLPSTAPYILYISITKNSISINGSHEPTLRLLSEYLTKWARLNHNDVRNSPMIKTELRDSFLIGVKDLLVVEAHDERWTWMTVGPAVILGFVEGVLGYGLMSNTSGTWVYRRERPFA